MPVQGIEIDTRPQKRLAVLPAAGAKWYVPAARRKETRRSDDGHPRRGRSMCGRGARTSSRATLAAEFGISRFVNVDLKPRYNIAPSQTVEAIIRDGDELRLGPLRIRQVPPESCVPPTNNATSYLEKGMTIEMEYRNNLRRKKGR